MAAKRPPKPIGRQTISIDDLYAAQVLGSLAMQPEIERVEPFTAPREQTERKKAPQLRVVRKRRAKPATKGKVQFTLLSKLVMLFAAALLLTAGILLVGKLAAVSQNNSLIAKRQQELSDETRRSQQLEVQLAMSDDLEQVISIASDELGMSAPRETMRRRISLDDTQLDETVVAQEQTQQKSGFLSMIEKITELLH